MDKISIDFTAPTGPVKQLNGVNNCPMRLKGGKRQGQPELHDIGVPYCRLHDTAGAWGGTHYVDIPNIFPDFDADENDPASYDFAFTDALLAELVAAGIEPFYRLGVTIENNWRVKAYNLEPPKDFAKWARICEHIVRHYNEGWADGYAWGLEFWEIWGEPENPPLWQGTREQYFELYRVTANHLKSCFPNIKVGGYGSCGLYAIDPESESERSEFFRSFLDWFDEFLAFVTAPATQAPLDFFSWHIYLTKSGPERIAAHAAYVRERLDRAGLAKTESYLDEWNDCSDAWSGGGFEAMKEMPGATAIAASFCVMQRAPIDKAMYYDALPSREYCGLFYFPGGPGHHLTPTYRSFQAFYELYKLGTAVASEAVGDKLYVLAAASGPAQAMLLVNRRDEEARIELEAAGAAGPFAVRLLDRDHPTLEPAGEWRPGDSCVLPAKSVLLLATEVPAASAPDAKAAPPTSRPDGIDDSVAKGRK